MLVPLPARVCSELAAGDSIGKDEGRRCWFSATDKRIPLHPALGPCLALLHQKADADSSKSGTYKAKPQHSMHLSAGVAEFFPARFQSRWGRGSFK